jgi:hypothetical protein
MSRVNHEEENIISGEIKPRRIKSKGNPCPGGKFWRKNYPEEKIWGKDGAKPSTECMGCNFHIMAVCFCLDAAASLFSSFPF